MQGAVDLTGYHLSFDAEMTSASDMNYFINHFNNGDTTISSNGELENYVPYSAGGSTYTFQNGELTIAATPTSSNGLPYTSGMLSTGYSFYQNTGYFEIRAQVPSTAGFWPAFWALGGGPTDYSSELDILEQPNNDGNSNYFTSIKTPQLNEGLFQNTGVDLSAGYHSYGLMWTATSMQFTLDGQYIGQVFATPAALQSLKMYMIANMAVGGGWAGAPAAGSSAQLKIDYIRAYSNDPSVPGWWGGTEAISSPDGVNTTPNLTGTSTSTTTTTGITTATGTTTTTAGTITPVVLGSGNDTLALFVNEDAYNGDAQFTVSVDGVQIGGTQTTTAIHGAGGTQEFDVKGTFATGAHTATINYLNDADGSGGDRNLYVTGATINGTSVPSSSLSEYSGGPQSLSFQGGDTLTLNVSEDAYQGDAQYRVLVDGYYVDGTYTATASHAAGLINTQTISGNWGKGAHTVGIQFINDAYGGSPSADRNLYINSVNFDGAAAPMSGTIAQGTNGVATVQLPATSTLTLAMAEDAWQGDAQFSLSIDGNQVAANSSVTASHAAGATQMFDFSAGLTAGLHDVALSFTNDAYGGSTSTDRNLYLSGASLNGTALGTSAWTQTFDSNGTSHFSLVVPSS